MPPKHVKPNSLSPKALSRLRTAAIVAWLALTLVGLTSVFQFEAATGRRFEADRAKAAHARDVVIAQEDLRSRLHLAESSALAYVLTGDKRYVDEYHSDSQVVLRLTGETNPNLAYRGEEAGISTQVRTRIAQLDRLTDLRSAGRTADATQNVAADFDNSAQLNGAIDRLIDRQLTDLKPLVRRALLVYQSRMAGFVAGAALFVFTMAVALLLTFHQLRLRRRAEAMLRDEAAKLTRLTTIIDSTSDFIGMTDARGKVLFHNTALRALLGRTIDEDVSGSFLHETLTAQSLEIMQNEALPIAVRDGIWSGETTFLSAGGEEIPVSHVLLAHKNADNSLSHLSMIARDISQNKRDQTELLEKQRFVEQIAAASPNILYLFDLVSKLNLYCNSRIFDVLGHCDLHPHGHDNLFAELMHPDDASSVALAQQSLMESDDRAVIVTEYRLRHATGEWRWMRSREMVFKRDEKGRPIQSIGVAEDVTEEKQVLDEMVHERYRLAAIIEAKRQIMQSTEGIDATMTLACDQAQWITVAEGAVISVAEGSEMVFKAAAGTHVKRIGSRIPAAESLAARCIATRQPAICGDADTDPRIELATTRKFGSRSLLVVPLCYENETLGALCVTSTKPNAFNDGDLHALSLISEFFAAAFARINQAAEKQRLLDEKTAALSRAQENEYLVRSTFSAVQEGLTVMNANGIVELCNPAASSILGVPEQDIIGLRGPLPGCRFLRRDGSDYPFGEFPSYVSMVTGMPVREVVIGIERPEDDIMWLTVSAVPLLDKDTSATTRVVTTFSDITARLASEKQLNELATTDGLTKINNHRAFQEQLATEMSRSIRYSHSLALLMLDVDHFKSFNDMFGHPAGDVILTQVAAILKEAARNTDFVARYGGEEFAVILPDTDSTGAAIIADRIRLDIEVAQWPNRPITASIGVASFSPDLIDGSDFVSRADRALYRAKTQGRNRVVVSSRGTTAYPRLPTQQAA